MSGSELDRLAGLESAKKAVSGIVERRSPVHAVLFFGEEGAGKRTLARHLAQYWLCTNPTQAGACGECRACGAFARGTSGDLLTIRPAGPSSIIRLAHIHPDPKAEIEGEPVLSIQEFLRTMPLLGRSKVVLMEDADRMNRDAANALLKTLEEPHEYARFVLMTTQIGRVPATVRSRCMAVPCELPAEIAAEGWVVTLAGRSVGRAARISASAEAYREIHDIAVSLRGSSAEAALAFSERFRRAVDKLQKSEDLNARSAGAAALQSLGAVLSSLQFTPAAIQRVAESHRRIVGNANAGLEFDALFAAILAENGST